VRLRRSLKGWKSVSPELRGLSKVAEVIREYYDLGEVQLPQQFEGAHQRRHRKMTVETDAGRFLVKTYRANPATLDALAFQHRLADHLEKHGLPVAAIQRTREGRGVVVLDDWALELQRFIEGRPMSIDSRSLVISAEALGRFHDVCRDLPTPPRDTRMWRFSEVPRSSFESFFERAREESSAPEVEEQCNRIALFLHDAASALSISQRKTFETGLIHGDWHGGNLLFHGDTLIAILDLEFAGAGCYLEDLAFALSNLCIRTTANETKMRTRSELVLETYQEARTLSPAELSALYYAVGVKHVTTVCYQSFQQKGTVAGFSTAQWMGLLDAQCQWLGGEARRIRWGG